MPPLVSSPSTETELPPSLRKRRPVSDSYSWVRTLNLRAEERAAQGNRGNCQGLTSIFCSPICLLLLCLPVGVLSHGTWHNHNLTFWMMFGAMIPLAKVLGDATEELALCLNNDMLSGLLNATFGNAVELIMTVSFLQTHQYNVVKMSLVGSVLSNMLLVLGMSFFAGGFVKTKSKTTNVTSPGGSSEPLVTFLEKQQKYSILGALVSTSMLLVACLVLCLVTVFGYVFLDANQGHLTMLPLSRACSVVIMLSYVAFIVFQLFTHKETMAEDDGDGDEEEGANTLSFVCSLGLLAGTTVVVAFASELLTGSLESALASSGMSTGFVSTILLPIVGNACEHAAAIRFAMQEKAGLSVGIAVGSSVQVAVFVAPLSVLMGWAVGPDSAGQNMDLNFGMMDVAVLTLSVIVVLSILLDGKSTWLEGYMLMTAYFIIGILYWFMPNVNA